MLGRRNPTLGLFGAQTRLMLKDPLKDLGFYAQVAANWRRVYKDDDFAPMYPKLGRRSHPPSIMATATLLQKDAQISDAEVVARTRFDLRWKYVFDLDPLSTDPLFAKSAFQAFRFRLAFHKREAILFETSVREACDNGLLPDSLRVALDGSPVHGRGALKDAYNMLGDAIALIVRQIARATERKAEDVAREAGVERHITAPSIKGTEFVEWDEEESLGRFLAGLLKDSKHAVAAAEEAGCASEEVSLLKTVIAENVDQTGEQPKIAKGVPKERTTSVHDPDMKHGRKSSGKLYTGHKAHIAVELTHGIITAVDVAAPAEAEGSRVASLIRQTAELTGRPVHQALGDTAYSSRKAIAQAKEVEVELVTKMSSPPKGCFGPGDFDVSEDGKTARCPAGHSSSKIGERKVKLGDEKVDCVLHTWTENPCATCPMKERCLRKPGKGKQRKREQRMLTVHPDFHDRRQREEFARSEEGRTLLRERVTVEHRIGQIKNHGAGQASYVGRAKTLFEWLCAAAVVNLKKTWSVVPQPVARAAVAMALLLLCLVGSWLCPQDDAFATQFAWHPRVGIPVHTLSAPEVAPSDAALVMARDPPMAESKTATRKACLALTRAPPQSPSLRRRTPSQRDNRPTPQDASSSGQGECLPSKQAPTRPGLPALAATSLRGLERLAFDRTVIGPHSMGIWPASLTLMRI